MRLLSLTAILLFLACSSSAEIIFEDSFDTGYSDNWTMFYDWYWADGRMYSDLGHSDNALGGGDPGCGYYIMSLDVMTTSANQVFAFVLFSQRDPSIPFDTYPNDCLTGYVFHIHTGTPGLIYEVNCSGVWHDYLDDWSILTPGVITHIQCGHLSGYLVYRHWEEGQSVPDWQYSRTHSSGWRHGYWYIFSRSDTLGTWIDNVRVEGTGTVGVELCVVSRVIHSQPKSNRHPL